MQAHNTTRWLREYHFNRGIFIALAVIGLLVASLVAIQVLTDGESASESQPLGPVADPARDFPYEAGYPGTTAGLNSTTLSRAANSAIGFTTEGLNTTTLNLDQNGADVFPAGAIGSVPAMDVTTLPLDRDGADIAVGLTADNAFGNADVDRAAAIDALGGSPALPPTGALGQLDY